MNLSERIRSLIANPLTAPEIHSKMPGVDIKLIRGLLQRMVIVGIAKRIGDKRPYQYQVARPLKQQNRGFDLKVVTIAQKIRDELKVQNMSPAEVGAALGMTASEAYKHMRDMVPGNYLCKMGDGKYMWLKDPKRPMTSTEKSAKEKARQADKNAKRRAVLASQPPRVRHPKISPLTVKKVAETQCNKPAQTVDEWLKAGGVIDRSPTVPKFERLTAEEISQVSHRQRSIVTVNAGRSYLTA